VNDLGFWRLDLALELIFDSDGDVGVRYDAMALKMNQNHPFLR